MIDETEAQNGEEMFTVTHMVTVWARSRRTLCEPGLGPLPSTLSKLNPRFFHHSICGCREYQSFGKEGSIPRILEMTIQLQSSPLWRPVRSLAETFLVPLQAKFSSSHSWELTDLETRRFQGRTKKCLSLLFTLPSWGSLWCHTWFIRTIALP